MIGSAANARVSVATPRRRSAGRMTSTDADPTGHPRFPVRLLRHTSASSRGQVGTDCRRCWSRYADQAAIASAVLAVGDPTTQPGTPRARFAPSLERVNDVQCKAKVGAAGDRAAPPLIVPAAIASVPSTCRRHPTATSSQRSSAISHTVGTATGRSYPGILRAAALWTRSVRASQNATERRNR